MRKNITKFVCVAVTASMVFTGAIGGSLLYDKTVMAEDDGTDEDADDEDDEDVKVALSDCEITFEESTHPYTGKAIKPEITVSYVDDEGDEVDLDEDEDYKVTYSNNTQVSKNAKVKVTGISEYCTGSLTESFTISKGIQKISGKNVSVKLSKKSYKLKTKCTVGDGKLSYASSKAAVASVDKTGKLTLHKKGKATITVTAKATANFKVTKKKIIVSVN